MHQKADFRKKLLEMRKALPEDVRHTEDALIAERVCTLPAFEDAEYVLAYLSFGNEVDTHTILQRAWSEGKAIVLPRCVEGTRDMRWFEVRSGADLEASSFGMKEPCPASCREITPAEYNRTGTVALVPGLAFDAQGYRIGYGGGFYDTFLADFTGTSVGLCRSMFLYDDLRAEKAIDRHDMPVDIVVTPLSVAD